MPIVSRTAAEWKQLCVDRITAGYIPGRGGDKDTFANVYTSGVEYVESILRPLELWTENDVILDVGCGNGRLPMQMTDDAVKYHGIEILKGCVDFCRMIFEPYSEFRFHHIDIQNDRYNRIGKINPLEVLFPIKSESIDVVIASSLFSHLGPWKVALHYLDEIERVMRKGACLFSTWFTSPPNEKNDECDRTVYPIDNILDRLSTHFIQKKIWDGTTTNPNDQMRVLAYKI